MSGLPAPDWQRDDAETFGEGVARCARSDCQAPLRMIAALTVVVLRCEFGHVHELHSCFARSWFGED